MKRKFSKIVGVFAVLLVASTAMSAQAKDKQEPVPAVVRLQTQICSALTVTGWDRHPQESEYQKRGSMPFGDTGYRIDFARLGPFRKTMIAERLHDNSRGVDDSYALFQKGISPYHAAYVITRMPPGDKPMTEEELLASTLRVQKENAGGGKISFMEIQTPFGKGVEMIVGGRIGSNCFPTSHFFYTDDSVNGSMGISRFVARGADLIEYSLVLDWPQGVSQAVMLERARAALAPLEAALVVDAPH